jgi:hypothetical protein
MTFPPAIPQSPAILILVAVCGLGGCSTSGPDHLEIDADRYEVAFSAAEEATRKAGMPAMLTDRTGGVIEGRPRLAGSLTEPWRVDNSSLEQWSTSTLHKQRRRVRFEFLPLDFKTPAPTGEETLMGAPFPGSGGDLDGSIDLDRFDGPIEVRVWVWIEREQLNELRRGTWSRQSRDYATNPMDTIAPRDGTTRSSGRWTPVERDINMERRLLAEVAAATTADAG